MQFKEEQAGALKQIAGYGDGGFRIGEDRYQSSLLLTGDGLHELDIQHLDDLDPEHLHPVTQNAVAYDVLLVGCGPTIQPLPQQALAALQEAGLAFDVMDTGAAARTYNLLLSEDRRVAGLLIAVE